MIRYTCPCSNVTLELAGKACENSDDPKNETKDTHLDQIKKTLDNQDNKLDKDLLDSLNAQFLHDKTYFEIKSFESEFALKSFDSHLKTKYPLFIGVLEKSFQEYTLKVNTCVVCDVATHCEFIEKKANEQVASGDNAKKSILENRQFSDKSKSHSTSTKNSDTNSHFVLSILVNSNKMNLDIANEELFRSDNYSSVYDIILDDSKETSDQSSSFDGLVIKINDVPIFEQRRFLNHIAETFRISSHATSSKEKTLKTKLETLVNSLTNTDDNNNKNNKLNEQVGSNSSASSGVQFLANKIQLKGSEPKKIRKKYDENALSSSVFEMEEIDEFGDEDKFLDNDSQDESDVDASDDKRQIEKSILKKRNSNIGDTEFRNDMIRISTKMNFSKNPINQQSSNQYSCSLPRDIPVMMTHRVKSMAKTYKESDNNNENCLNPVKEQHKHHTQLISNSFKQPNAFLNYNFNTSNDEEGDDDLFEDDADNQENFELDEDDTTNMGQAISSLASSIVIKDGRELFGGVPSRRVPINSISKSCYE